MKALQINYYFHRLIKFGELQPLKKDKLMLGVTHYISATKQPIRILFCNPRISKPTQGLSGSSMPGILFRGRIFAL